MATRELITHQCICNKCNAIWITRKTGNNLPKMCRECKSQLWNGKPKRNPLEIQIGK